MHIMLWRNRWYSAGIVAACLAVLVPGCSGGTGADDPEGRDTPSPDEQATTPGTGEGSEAPEAGSGDAGDTTEQDTTGEPAEEEPDTSGTGSTAEPPSTPPDLDVEVRLTEVARFASPTAAAFSPEGVLHVAERAGTVRPLTDEGPGAPVLDLTDETSTGVERGLLGLAFAPDGTELFTSSTDGDGDTLVQAFGFEDGEVIPERRRRIFTLEQPYANHNGGDITFGDDELLYIGLGDGGGAGDPLGAGQDLSTPLGALLRIDPFTAEPYAVPDDNPFVDREDAAGEILVYGVRNPWRFSFDRATGDLWIADVGQDTAGEINRLAEGQVAGANLGWNLMEGTYSFAGEPPEDHVPPVQDHTLDDGRCAVTGGYVYRGSAIPELTGAYLYSDLCVSTVRALVVDDDGNVVDEGSLDVAGEQVVSFAQDADGELYLLELAGGLLRLEPA